MKTLILAICLTSASAFAQGDKIQQHFEQASEVSCEKELSQAGCGKPKSDHDEAFLACAEEKMSTLSKECQRIQKDLISHQ